LKSKQASAREYAFADFDDGVSLVKHSAGPSAAGRLVWCSCHPWMIEPGHNLCLAASFNFYKIVRRKDGYFISQTAATKAV
jgi:hypothetical protein